MPRASAAVERVVARTAPRPPSSRSGSPSASELEQLALLLAQIRHATRSTSSISERLMRRPRGRDPPQPVAARRAPPSAQRAQHAARARTSGCPGCGRQPAAASELLDRRRRAPPRRARDRLVAHRARRARAAARRRPSTATTIASGQGSPGRGTVATTNARPGGRPGAARALPTPGPATARRRRRSPPPGRPARSRSVVDAAAAFSSTRIVRARTSSGRRPANAPSGTDAALLVACTQSVSAPSRPAAACASRASRDFPMPAAAVTTTPEHPRFLAGGPRSRRLRLPGPTSGQRRGSAQRRGTPWANSTWRRKAGHLPEVT